MDENYRPRMLTKDQKINEIKGLEKLDTKSVWKDLKLLLNPNKDMTECTDKNEWFKGSHPIYAIKWKRTERTLLVSCEPSFVQAEYL